MLNYSIWKYTQERHNNLPVHPWRNHVCNEPKYIFQVHITAIIILL